MVVVLGAALAGPHEEAVLRGIVRDDAAGLGAEEAVHGADRLVEQRIKIVSGEGEASQLGDRGLLARPQRERVFGMLARRDVDEARDDPLGHPVRRMDRDRVDAYPDLAAVRTDDPRADVADRMIGARCGRRGRRIVLHERAVLGVPANAVLRRVARSDQERGGHAEDPRGLLIGEHDGAGGVTDQESAADGFIDAAQALLGRTSRGSARGWVLRRAGHPCHRVNVSRA